NAIPLKHKNTFLEYKGTLVNDQKKPLAGAKIRSSAGERTVITDRSGTFSISAEPGDTLYVSLTGYKDLTVVLTDNTSLSLAMETDKPVVISDGSKNVELIYTTAPARLTTASNDAVYYPDLIKSPVTSFRNAITGRLAGLYTLQSSGLPGADGASLTLR